MKLKNYETQDMLITFESGHNDKFARRYFKDTGYIYKQISQDWL